MQRYYFNIYNDDVTLDEEGAELIDAHAARAHAIHAARSLAADGAHAIHAARSLAADTALHGHIGLSHRIEIEDENHQVIDKITFGDAVEVRS